MSVDSEHCDFTRIDRFLRADLSRMKDLRNVLIGEDFGTIQIAADRADFRSVDERGGDSDDEPGTAERADDDGFQR